MARKAFLAIFFLAGLLTIGRAEEKITNEEYEVYADILRPVLAYPGKENKPIRYNLWKSTSTMGIEGLTLQDQVFVKLAGDAHLALDEGLSEDFLQKNQKEFVLSEKFDVPGLEIRLISPENRRISLTFPVDPDSCFQSFSRVGFNKSRSQALVIGGTHCEPEGGGGHLFLLVKENSNWKIKGRVRLWIE